MPQTQVPQIDPEEEIGFINLDETDFTSMTRPGCSRTSPRDAGPIREKNFRYGEIVPRAGLSSELAIMLQTGPVVRGSAGG